MANKAQSQVPNIWQQEKLKPNLKCPTLATREAFIKDSRTDHARGIAVFAEEHTRTTSTHSRNVIVIRVSHLKEKGIMTCGHVEYHVEYTEGFTGDVIYSQCHSM